MSKWIMPPADLIEPVPAQEIYADGIGAIEFIGGNCVRIILYQEQLPLEGPIAIPHKVVVLKLIRPLASMTESIGQVANCLTWKDEGPRGPRLVK